MYYEYKFKKIVIIAILILTGIFIFMSKIYYFEHKTIYLIVNFAVILIFIIHGIPALITGKTIINDWGIKESEIYWGRYRVKELKWDEIGYIVDDYVSPILFYPPYKWHIFHIMPKDYIIKPFKRISISPGMRDYKELLKKVVEHVSSDVVIEDYISEFLKRYEEKKLKREKKRA